MPKMIPTKELESTGEQTDAASSAPRPAIVSDPLHTARKRSLFKIEERQEFRHRLAVMLAVALSWFARVQPDWLRNWLADRSGDLFYLTFKTYRENVKANLSQVLGLPEDDKRVRRTALRVFRASSRNFSDMLMVPHMTSAEIAADGIAVEGDWSIMDDALAAGKGLILLTGHLGSFDYVGQILGARGYRLTIMTTRTTARFIFDAVTYLRRSKGVSMVEASPSGVRKAMQALRRGECVVLASDRDFHLNGKPVTFFGERTTLPPGAVRIGRETGAPLVPMFGTRLRKGQGVRILPAFSIEKTKDIDADLELGLGKIVKLLEQAISATPDQWFMFQRVWPTGPVDPVRVFPVGSPLETDILERVGAALPGRRRSRPTD
jgi:Kdo2-lipid IVA lauroyltransferase/acyltransferase